MKSDFFPSAWNEVKFLPTFNKHYNLILYCSTKPITCRFRCRANHDLGGSRPFCVSGSLVSLSGMMKLLGQSPPGISPHQLLMKHSKSLWFLYTLETGSFTFSKPYQRWMHGWDLGHADANPEGQQWRWWNYLGFKGTYEWGLGTVNPFFQMSWSGRGWISFPRVVLR